MKFEDILIKPTCKARIAGTREGISIIHTFCRISTWAWVAQINLQKKYFSSHHLDWTMNYEEVKH